MKFGFFNLDGIRRASLRGNWQTSFRGNRLAGFLKVFIVLFFLGLLAYYPTIFYPFVHDDIVFIQQNPSIFRLNLTDLFQQFTPSLPGVNPYWRPGLEIVYRLQYQLFHFNPSGYHFFNILLHVINSALVFYNLRFLLQRPGMALIVATVFLLHPVQSEAVACISGVSNLLYVFFCLLSLLFYGQTCQPQGRVPPLVSYSLSLLTYSAALLVKEQAIIWPFLVAFIEYFFLSGGRKKMPLMFWKIGGFILITVFYLLLRKLVLGTSMVAIGQYPHELVLRILAIPRAVLMYAQILLWPQDLHYYRSIDILTPWQPAAIGLLIITAGVFFLAGSVLKPMRRPFLLGLGWFVITLLPTLNILPLIHEYSYIAAFEHFLYLPMAGFFLSVCLIVEQLITKIVKHDNRRMVIAVILGALSLLCLGLTFRQNQYWRGEVPLFERAVQYENKLGRVHFLLGRAYYFGQRYDEAAEAFQKALAIMQGYLPSVQSPTAQELYFRFIKDIYFDLAHCWEAKKDWPKALDSYRQILKITPGLPEIHNNIGNVYIQMGDLKMAQEQFEQTLRIMPKHLMAMSNLAVCYIRENKLEEAEKLLRQALAIDSQFTAARQNLEQLLLEKQRY